MTEFNFKTLADDLLVVGVEPSPGGYRCTVTNPATGRTCNYRGMAGEFASVGDIAVIDRDYICGGCAQDLLRLAQAVGSVMTSLAIPAPWDSEEGTSARVKRDALITDARWRADPLTSPYTEACRLAWAERIKYLNRITVDFERPGVVDWGVAPPEEFM